MKTRFILINTSHAGNVGAAARAMRVMGFDDMVLVAPRWANVLRREETIQRASGALDVLKNARIVDTLDEALDGVDHLCATAMTPRDFGPPTLAPRAHFAEILGRKRIASEASTAWIESAPELALLLNTEHIALTEWALQPDLASIQAFRPEGVAFLFGSERFGMNNEDVYRCNVALSIPTDPKFGSLNLGAAVQLIAYDWREALGSFAVEAATATRKLADDGEIAGMLAHWEKALTDIGFLDPAAPKKLMPRLNQLFNRSQLGTEEIHILRGIAKAMTQQAASRPSNASADDTPPSAQSPSDH